MNGKAVYTYKTHAYFMSVCIFLCIHKSWSAGFSFKKKFSKTCKNTGYYTLVCLLSLHIHQQVTMLEQKARFRPTFQQAGCLSNPDPQVCVEERLTGQRLDPLCADSLLVNTTHNGAQANTTTKLPPLLNQPTNCLRQNI